MLCEADIKNLELIRDTCTSIATLELLLPPDSENYTFSDSPIAAEVLYLLDMRFKAIPSLKEIIVHLQVYAVEDLSDYPIKMRECGWTVETKLLNRVWISDDGRVEFHNEEDCDTYNNEQLLFEWQRDKEKEEEEWTEEYHRRRRDPYWKNDSDYD